MRHSLRVPLRAAGAGLNELVLRFPADLPTDHPLTPLLTKLRVLRPPAPHTAHLLEWVLAAPHLEELVIEVENSENDGNNMKDPHIDRECGIF